jgi:cell volume regulation protein A
VHDALVPRLGRPAFRMLHVRMRVVEPEPWALGVRLQDETAGVHRLMIKASSPADGRTIDNLAGFPGTPG